MVALSPQLRTGRGSARPGRLAAPTVSPRVLPRVQAKSACVCGGSCPACRGAEGSLTRAETAARQEPLDASPLPAPVLDVSRTPGRPLAPPELAFFEERHGRDLGGVRLHTDAPAAASATSVGARAYSAGQHIAFAESAYAPGTVAGISLLAHEIAHTIEGPQGAVGLRREDADGDAALVAANAMIGLPAGSQLVITRSMSAAIFSLLRSKAPDVAGALGAVSDQRATVVTAEADRVEIRFNARATLPAGGEGNEQQDTTIRDLTLSLARTASGTFDFVISGRIGAAPAMLYEETGLSVRAQGGRFILSDGSEPHLRLTPAGSATGSAQVEAFTAPYLAGQPDLIRNMAPETVGLISIQGLPAAPEGSTEAEEVARRAIARAAAQRRPPRSTLTLGAGIAGGIGARGISPFAAATYRYAFTPTDLGNLVQIPLQLDIMYAPTTSVLGAVSSGIGSSLGTIEVPLNVRITAGLGGGSIAGPPVPGAEEVPGPATPVLGPTIGIGAGYQSGWFRVEVRGDLLFNVLPGPAPTVLPAASLMLGGAF